MTIASVLIQQAYRENNIVPVGSTVSTALATEGLARLNRFYQMLIGTVMGEFLEDWLVPAPQRTAPVAANFPQLPYPEGLDGNLLALPMALADPTIQVWPYPPQNSRIVFAGDAGSTWRVYFPEEPSDGAMMGLIQGATGPSSVTVTLDGNGRTIGAAATQPYTSPLSAKRWIYRADLGDWRLVADLIASDEVLFAPDMDDFTVCGLALRLAPAYDKVAGAAAALAYKDGLSAFRARYKQRGTTTFGAGNIPGSLQSYRSGRWWY